MAIAVALRGTCYQDLHEYFHKKMSDEAKQMVDKILKEEADERRRNKEARAAFLATQQQQQQAGEQKVNKAFDALGFGSF